MPGARARNSQRVQDRYQQRAESAPAFYHFAFDCPSVEALERKREELAGYGIDVTPVVDHEWCRSIYFNDPNGLLLEYCTTVREFNDDDKIMKHRVQPGPMVKDPEEARRVREKLIGRTAPKTEAV